MCEKNEGRDGLVPYMWPVHMGMSSLKAGEMKYFLLWFTEWIEADMSIDEEGVGELGG